MKSLILLGVVLNLSFIACKSACNDFKTCGDCIGYAKERCVWCAQDPIIEENPTRCRSRAEIKDTWCLHYTHNPNSTHHVQENKNFSSDIGQEIQLRPQLMNVTLRPGVPVSFNMSYQPAKDYPLDLYFLMDNSYTMKPHAKELAKQAKNIYAALKRMTKNVLIGLGTFVEKPELPYSDPRIKTSYAFKHHLSLTDDMTLFKKKVDSYPSIEGSNYDSPEAGLDALMQVMTCEKRIGWRNNSTKGPQSRRIILVATDATYHSAGDGKMLGAYVPNNMSCLLDKNDMYKEKASLMMDYPSVSQINYVAQQKDMMIVFTVLGKVMSVYNTLKDGIQKAQAVELKANDIVKIVEDSYKTASRNVLIERRNVPAMINVTTFCGKCLSTQENPEVIINTTITALQCPKNKSDLSFDLEVSGLPDKLTVKVNIDCECTCENVTPKTIKSPECNNVGYKLCGVCKCDQNRSGDRCDIECSSKDAFKYMYRCKQTKEANTYCSGQGICLCGECKCNSDYSGNHCEFNDAECRRHCPEDRGDCNLGQCICKDYSQWTGPKCDCPLSNKTCISPFSTQPCSGEGTCSCGKCICNSKDSVNYGLLAYCTESAKDLCEKLKAYAFCSYEMKSKAECDKSYTKTSVDKVSIMNKTQLEEETSATACRKKLDDGNFLVYKFMITTDHATDKAELELMIQNELESPPVVNLWTSMVTGRLSVHGLPVTMEAEKFQKRHDMTANVSDKINCNVTIISDSYSCWTSSQMKVTVGSVVGGVLFVGLLTLIIWKVLTGIYDKREYERFCKEATEQGFDVANPVYLDPTVSFVNPAFQGQVKN